MDKKNEENKKEIISLLSTFASDLKGRQSVRATFRLTEGCIDAISIVANQMGIKQKSLFDHLAEDIQSLESIADKIRNTDSMKKNRVQKTFVISRRSLLALDIISKEYNAPRDALVELSIQRLLPIIRKEQKKHEKRKTFLAEIDRHYKNGEELFNSIREELGQEDPLVNRFEMVMAGYAAAKADMETFIEKSKCIEEFDLDVMHE